MKTKSSIALLSLLGTVLMSSPVVYAANESSNDSNGKIIALVVIAIVVIAALAFSVRKTFFKETSSKAEKKEGLLGQKQVRRYYESFDNSITEFSCLTYMAFDTSTADDVLGKKDTELLQEDIINTLNGFCGESDCAARIGDGEFLLCIRSKNVLSAQQRINDLVENMNARQEIILSGKTVPLAAGIYLSEVDKVDFSKALKYSKLAYKYAHEGELCSYVCTKQLLNTEKYRENLREKLSAAIDNDEFEMFVQFIYNVNEGKFTNAEVLSRWNSPTDGLLMPAYYITDMKKSGVIVEFDYYMFEKTCRQLEKWQNSEFADIKLSCNITRATISDPKFADTVMNIIKKYKFDHEKLMIEITEYCMIDKEIARANLNVCRELDIGVAIDDFCEGCSMLDDINDYPVDQIKLDRHTIARNATKQGNMALRDVIDLAHRMNISVVCEGVETAQQRDTVLSYGSDFIQGYYYSYVYSTDEGQKFYLKSLN